MSRCSQIRLYPAGVDAAVVAGQGDEDPDAASSLQRWLRNSASKIAHCFSVIP